MSEDRPRLLIAGAYPLALLLVLLPVTSVAITLWPLRPSEVSWRYGAFGIAMQAATLPLLGLAVACVAAYLLGHPAVLRGLAVVALLCASVSVVGLLLFGLDTLRMRPMVQPDALGQFGLKTLWAAFAALLSAAVLGWTGLAAWRAAGGAEAHAGPGAARLRRDGPALIDDALSARARGKP